MAKEMSAVENFRKSYLGSKYSKLISPESFNDTAIKLPVELNPFILHASLDILEDLQWQTHPQSGAHSGTNSGFLRSRHSSSNSNCYLGKIDHFYGLAITGYLSYGNMKFVMVHSGNANNGSPVVVDDVSVKSFYQEVHELYVKTLMNPFYTLNEPITSPVFDGRVRALAKKLLTK